MIYYYLKDFFTSRPGQVTLFMGFLIGLFFVVKAQLNPGTGAEMELEEEAGAEEPKPALPTLGGTTPWDDPEGEFTFTERNEDFRPFVPAVYEPPAPPETKTVPEAAENPSHVGAGFPLPPLILVERAAPVPPEPPEGEGQPEVEAPEKEALPGVEIAEGTVLTCELTAPVYSDQGDGVVSARLARPLVRSGRQVLPSGTRIAGRLQSARAGRLYFDRQWRVQLPGGEWVSVSGDVQQVAFDHAKLRYTSNDGRSGLPATVGEVAEKKGDGKWKRVLGTVASAAARMGQDRARTVVGEFIPGTARNILLGGASEVIDDVMLREEPEIEADESVVGVPAGTGFYLATSR